MSMEGIPVPKLLVQSAREQTARLLEESRLARSRSAELRLHSQDLRARTQALRAHTAFARDGAAKEILRASFVSVLSEPLPERLRNAMSGGPPMNDTDLNSETAKLNQTAQRAKEFSRQAANMAGESRKQSDKAHRRAQQAHDRMADARQHTEGIHTQEEATYQAPDDAHYQLKRDHKTASKQ